jgi:beta-RFAP synthase
MGEFQLRPVCIVTIVSPPAPPVLTASRVRAAVRVRAPGRLHLGFLDPSGTLGRRFGSLGLVIDGFETELELGGAGVAGVDMLRADSPAAQAELERAAEYLQRLRQQTGLYEPLALHLRRVLPAHAGFGSGTQLALAVGRAFSHWHGLAIATPTLARWLDRGRRSGIGIAGFDTGGLLVDGGPGPQGEPAVPLARIALPEPWRIVVAIDPRQRGLSGAAEREAIARLAPLPREHAADICHQVLMRVLPGAAAADFASFAAGVNRVQSLLGAHFAPAQAGSEWTSPAVGHLMQWLREGSGDTAAIGQSSWGPTAFAIVPSVAAAQALIAAAARAGAIDAGLELHTVRGRNIGATLAEVPAR